MLEEHLVCRLLLEKKKTHVCTKLELANEIENRAPVRQWLFPLPRHVLLDQWIRIEMLVVVTHGEACIHPEVHSGSETSILHVPDSIVHDEHTVRTAKPNDTVHLGVFPLERLLDLQHLIDLELFLPEGHRLDEALHLLDGLQRTRLCHRMSIRD